jgi:hypothetical protein
MGGSGASWYSPVKFCPIANAIPRASSDGGDLAAAFQAALKYCRENQVPLTDLFTEHASEVENMLTTEFDMNTFQRVVYEEGVLDGIGQGMEQEKIDNARRMLEDNLPIEQIAKFTLLPIETIRSIRLK